MDRNPIIGSNACGFDYDFGHNGCLLSTQVSVVFFESRADAKL